MLNIVTTLASCNNHNVVMQIYCFLSSMYLQKMAAVLQLHGEDRQTVGSPAQPVGVLLQLSVHRPGRHQVRGAQVIAAIKHWGLCIIILHLELYTFHSWIEVQRIGWACWIELPLFLQFCRVTWQDCQQIGAFFEVCYTLSLNSYQ